MFLKRLGPKNLKKAVYPHLFRQVQPLLRSQNEPPELCYRYAGDSVATCLNVYISRAGMMGKELDAKFHSD